MPQLRGFASDNSSGAHPAILAAIAAANTGHALAYGGDPFTRAAEQRLAEHFGADSRVFFVFGGTGANVVGLAALLRPYQALICAHNSHVNVDECGAAERFIGCKLLPVRADDGKLTPQALAPLLARAGDVHSAQPGVISVTQPTEQGTVYAIARLQALAADFAPGPA
jgi:threonine aldolase